MRGCDHVDVSCAATLHQPNNSAADLLPVLSSVFLREGGGPDKSRDPRPPAVFNRSLGCAEGETYYSNVRAPACKEEK